MFDSIMHVSEDGTRYWTGRELAKMLGYDTTNHFDRFIKAYEKAKDLMLSQNENPNEHATTTGGSFISGNGAKREYIDFMLAIVLLIALQQRMQ